MSDRTTIIGTRLALAAQRRLKARKPSILMQDAAEQALLIYEQLVDLDLVADVDRLISRRKRLLDAQEVEREAA